MSLKNKKITTIVTTVGLALSAGFIIGIGGWFGGGGSIPADTMTRGLVGYWSMDEGFGDTAYDASGNANNGTLGAGVAANKPQWDQGKVGGALQFDGVNDYVDAGNAASLNITEAITLEAWVKPTRVPFTNYDRWVSKTNSAYTLGGNLTSANYFGELYLNGAARSLTGNSSLVQDNWYHSVLTYDGSVWLLYLNGVEDARTTAFSGAIGTNANNVAIGAHPDVSQPSKALIDEVRIYNRALSAEEVRYHYNRGGPVAQWKFDEGSGVTVKDLTENNNDGSIKSSALKFDGVDDYVSVSDSTSLRPTYMTVEAWIYRTGVGVGNVQGFVTKFNTSNNRGYHLYYYAPLNRLYFGVNNGAGGSLEAYTSDDAILTNTWYHCVGTYDGQNIRVYVNLVQGTAIPYTDTPLQDSTALEFGREGNAYFNGLIDEVRIYNRALSPTEIAEHYKGKFSDETGLVLNIPFTDAAGTTARDDSGQGNNGTLYNFDYTGAGQGDSQVDGWVIDTSWQTGKYGSALNFGGTNGFFQTDAAITGSSNFSHSLWFKSSDGTYSANEYLFSQGDDDPSVYVGTNGKLNAMGDNALKITSTRTVLDTNWHHLQITADGTNIYLYLDGALEGSVAYTGSSDTAGISAGGFIYRSLFFSGYIDDIRVYNYARTADEIRLDYNAGFAAKIGGTWDFNSGQVGYWSFDQGTGSAVPDLSGNGNNGTWSGTGTHWTTGKVGGAGQFNGVNDYVDAGNGASLKNITEAVTVEAWAMQRGWQNWAFIVKNSSTASAWDGYLLGAAPDSGNMRWLFSVVQDKSASANDFTIYDTWYHLVGTWDKASGIGKLYINGVLQTATFTHTLSLPVNTTPTTIGNAIDAYFLNGLIDEVRIYNRALSAEEIRFHYNRGGPVAHWKFDEGSGTTAQDTTDNNNNGTLAGKTSGTADAGTDQTKLVDDALSSTDDIYNNHYLKATSGSASGNSVKISDYDGATKTATFATNLTGFTSGDTYEIYNTSQLVAGPTWETGKHGTALSFDGVNDYVDAGDINAAEGINTLTVSAWTKLNPVSYSKWIVGKDNGADLRSWLLLHTETGVWFSVFSPGEIIAKSTTLIDDGNWHYLEGVYDGSEIRLYVDGILEATTLATGNINSNTYPVEFGRVQSDSGTYFSGLIDDVRIYNYARTADEIRQDYNQGLATKFGQDGGEASLMTQGLVGYWPMDEGGGTSVYDLSVNSNNGTCYNMKGGSGITDCDWRSPGKVGAGALSFDGVNDYVDAGNSASLWNNTTGAIEAWIKIPERDVDRMVFSVNNNQNQELAFWIRSGTGGVRFRVRLNAEASPCHWEYYGGPVISTNEWHHIVLTQDGVAPKFYLDGVLSITVSAGSDLTAWSDDVGSYPFYIGITNGYASYFKGLIDEVRIYNRTLSVSEVRYHYNRGRPVAHWRFDEGTGQIAFDESENNNDGTLYSSTTACSDPPTAGCPKWETGHQNSALSFDGVDDYVEAPHSASLNFSTGDFTIEAWIKTTDLTQASPIVQRERLDNTWYALLFWGNMVWLEIKDGVGSANIQSVANAISAGQWAHIVVYRTGGSGATYVNGVNKTSGTPSGTNLDTTKTAKTYIGGYPGWVYFNGLIDDVRIYNYARSAEEILVDYNNGLSTHFK